MDPSVIRSPIFLAENSLICGDCSGSQESEFRSQNGNTGDVDELRRLLEEVSKLLEAYSRAILNSDSCLPEYSPFANVFDNGPFDRRRIPCSWVPLQR